MPAFSPGARASARCSISGWPSRGSSSIRTDCLPSTTSGSTMKEGCRWAPSPASAAPRPLPTSRRPSPLLTEAIGEIGHRAIRNRGTIGGSIAHADPAAELPACLVALRATFHLVSSATTRDVESVDFFTGPFTTVLETGEILLGITVPPPPIAATQAWLEFSRRHGDFSLIGVAAIIDWAGDGSIADLDLAYSGAYWTPWQPPDEVVAPARGEWPENTVFERVGASAAGPRRRPPTTSTPRRSIGGA